MVLVTGQVDFSLDWRKATRKSAHLAPDPKVTKDAIVQVYAARAYNWRGLFAVHAWIAAKPKNQPYYTVYQSLGWNLFRGRPYVDVQNGIPDAYWFGHKPHILFSIRGKAAEKAISEFPKVIETYPYHHHYLFWPGPNSNTFIAYVIRHIPTLHFRLPTTMIGKDYLERSIWLTNAPSGTGYQFSIKGILGIIFAKKEGLELNILGLNIAIQTEPPFLHLPGLG
jgi:hypothetical protein